MSFERIDRHASQASRADEDTFENLIKYFEKGMSPYDERDLYMTRAVMVWLYLKYTEQKEDNCADYPGSQVQIIRDLKRKERTFPEVFKTLCRKANVECEIINGISRSGDYQAGDIDSRKLTAKWNAVKISGQWRLVYPRWVVQSVRGFTSTGIVLEAEGKKIHKSERKYAGTLTKEFNDFWFLTDPTIFIYKCMPDVPKWQLLPMAAIQKSRIAFLKQPNYTQWAFKYGLRLTRDQTCVLHSKNGFCLIEFKAESENCMMELSLSGTLKLLTSEETYGIKHNLVQYFPPTQAKRRTYGFKIRFPQAGKYNFAVKAGPRKNRETKHLICDFMIICKNPMKNFKPLPVEVGETGWAPGPDAIDAGLTEPSVSEPNVTLKPRSESTETLVDEVAEFCFKVAEGMYKLHDYETVMFGSDFVDEDDHRALQENVNVMNDEDKGLLNIKASVPKDGEYALVIKTVPKKGPKVPKSVCNYMLTTADTASDEVESDDSDYSSDEEFQELNTKIKELKREKLQLEEMKAQMLEKIHEQTE